MMGFCSIAKGRSAEKRAESPKIHASLWPAICLTALRGRKAYLREKRGLSFDNELGFFRDPASEGFKLFESCVAGCGADMAQDYSHSLLATADRFDELDFIAVVAGLFFRRNMRLSWRYRFERKLYEATTSPDFGISGSDSPLSFFSARSSELRNG